MKASDPKDTPMMRQYLEVKAQQPDCLLLMRMGDFFEAFLDDAKQLSQVCGVALTARNKDDPNPVPMAGVPHHSLNQYLPKLLAAGVRVAIMDQLEDPEQAKAEGRSLVRRGLSRVLTAGTLLDEDALSATDANYLVAITGLEAPIGIAALDVSTGRFWIEEATSLAMVGLALARLQPAEIVVPESVREDAAACARLADLIAPLPPLASLPAYAWKGGDARRYLCERFRVAALDGFGIAPSEDHLASAAAAAVRYASGSVAPGQDGNTLGHVRAPQRLHGAGHLILDGTCRRNLDLLRNARDNTRQGTLLAAIDRTCTALGSRLLAEWLARPLAVITSIRDRHDAVAALVRDDRQRADLREALQGVYDLERLLARIATGRANARDLVQLASSLNGASTVAIILASSEQPKVLRQAQADLNPDADLAATITATLVDEPPLAIGEGGMVRDGVDSELDELRAIKADASAWLAAYQVREAEACGLPKLKVGYNKVFGYFIELSKAHAEKVPAHFIRKQTLVNAERYITPELKDYEDKALGAEDRIRSTEMRILLALRERAERVLSRLQACAEAVAICDCLAGLAESARRGNWCRPELVDEPVLELRQARHPVVESVVGAGHFVANDAHLCAHAPQAAGGAVDAESTDPRLAIITGPNMAGKSTYIRQIALAVILAQAGSFVPAQFCRLGVVDRVFTRVGAGDELARGQSTFMVEMAETAAILNHATARSLVVLDEVGRGTSTFDGLSLAWAIVEHLHDAIGCRALFATHYHELTDLAEDRPGIVNLTVAVAEQDDDVVFLHRIEPGAATKSYGIHVAGLAGVPRRVITRARAVLSTLEQLNVNLTERERAAARPSTGGSGPVQLTLFEAAEHPIVGKLRELDLDDLSPRQALDMLAKLQREVQASHFR